MVAEPFRVMMIGAIAAGCAFGHRRLINTGTVLRV